MEPTDPELVEALRRADPRAFDLAFDRYRAPIWRFLLRMGGRAELAEELLQDTFLRLAAHAARLRPDTNLRAWLFTVARNLYRSHRRWAWVDGQRLAELAARALRAGSEPTPLELASASETGRRLERALSELAPANREVALLVWVERMEPGEVAVMLGLKPEAVRQRLARARQALASVIGGGEP